MNYRLIGAFLIVFGSGCFGFSAGVSHRKKERMLSQLYGILEYMECELQYCRMPLPELCRKVSGRGISPVNIYFLKLTEQLESQISPDVRSCVYAALAEFADFPDEVKEVILLLADILGEFDLDGQLLGLQTVKAECNLQLEGLRNNRDTRIRNYRTLALCAGAALAILLV